jgi:hypothetical protein
MNFENNLNNFSIIYNFLKKYNIVLTGSFAIKLYLFKNKNIFTNEEFNHYFNTL